MAFVALLALALLVSQGTALAALVRCKGGKCEGTQQADDLRGTVAKDQIFGLGGDDVVTARGSEVRITGDAVSYDADGELTGDVADRTYRLARGAWTLVA